MIGILPTLTPDHLTGDSLSANPRYALINEQIFAARGEDLHIVIDGPERLAIYADTIAPEAACTSVQFHLQVSPQDYANHWNAAQCIAGVQLALGANSPFLFGKELWRETRIALFEQATDTRPQELKAQGVRPRVWFGERWITSIFDQFEENVTLLPGAPAGLRRRGPGRGARAAATPRGWRSCGCTTAPSTAGTARSMTSSGASRTCGSRTGCCPPARPWSTSWPTARSTTAWCDCWPSRTGPMWSQMSFAAAEDNFYAGARTRHRRRSCTGPGSGEVPATELVLRRLLPHGPRGPGRLGGRQRDQRPAAGHHRAALHRPRQNGAEWQARHLPPHRRPQSSRSTAATPCARCSRRYVEHMHSNEPVHTWPTG